MAISTQTMNEGDVRIYFYGDSSYAAALASGKIYEATSVLFGNMDHNIGARREEIETVVRFVTTGVREGKWPRFKLSGEMPFRQYDNPSEVTAYSVLSGRGYVWDSSGANWLKNTTRTERNNFGLYVLINQVAQGGLRNQYIDVPGCVGDLGDKIPVGGEAVVSYTISSPYSHDISFGYV